MSFRLLTNRLFKHGRFFWRSSFKRNIYTNILENGRNRRIPSSLTKTGSNNFAIKSQTSTGFFRFQQHARKLFIDNVLNRVTSQYSEDLRNQARKKLFFGDSAPFFALIGVSLASGAGVLTKEDELEGVCWEIREAASKIQNSWNSEDLTKTINDDFDLDQLDVGPPIAKGCAAVVYAAAFKNQFINKNQSEPLNVPTVDSLNTSENDSYKVTNSQNIPEMLSPIQNISRFVHNFGGSVDNLHTFNQDFSFSPNLVSQKNFSPDSSSTKDNEYSNQNQTHRTNFSEEILQINSLTEQLVLDASSANICRYPLALKMMFNYDIQSNAMAILRAMYKETLPARRQFSNITGEDWERSIQEQTAKLPPHPNIVLMFGYFCSEVRNFRDGHILYPIAQPPRINPNGYGRNMSLYLLMKRYDYSLKSFLENSKFTEKINLRTRLLLFAQLLEAIAHLNRHGIAHRDLKSDNILIELNDDNSTPVLVLSDFGCCLADKINGLQIPYSSSDIDKGGNIALMAPEIITQQPGTFSILNYSKSDLWAAGAIAYEIFGLKNPFYNADNNRKRKIDNDPQPSTSATNSKTLRNIDYNETDLPSLNNEVPIIVRELILNILSRKPNDRLSPDVAANVMQIFLWAPSVWLQKGGMPSSPEILQWLLSLATKVMTEGQTKEFKKPEDELKYKMGRRTYTEYLLICSFLSRVRLRRIRGALSWIQNIII